VEKSKILEESLKAHEGIKLRIYQCTAKKWSIGCGRNLEDNGISIEEAEFMLQNDIETHTRYAISWVGDPGVWNSLTSERKAVIIELMFNMGPTRMATFRKMKAAVLAGDWQRAAFEMMDSKWQREDVGKGRSSTLIEQMRSGVYRGRG